MFGNWIKRRIQLTAIRGGTEDLQRFVISLRGQSHKELGMLVALATVLRIHLRDEGILPDDALRVDSPMPSEKTAEVQFKLSHCVKLFQEHGQLPNAAGAMVWLHTLRASNYPELRLLGREMWDELRRGFDYAEESLGKINGIAGKRTPDEAYLIYEFIPPGLEPASH